MKYKLLLLDDVINLGRKGEIVDVNPGFARNFLIPKEHGIVATKSALKMQEQLVKERQEQAVKDKAEARELADKLEKQSFSIVAKVDIEGNMYGSIKPQDIAQILQKAGYSFDRKQIQIPHTIKKIGSLKIELSLKEGVKSSISLEVKPDREVRKKKPVEPKVADDAAELEQTDGESKKSEAQESPSE
jgi:large subunit ribosomal protein L9